MKTRNLFDHMDKEHDNIDEKSVLENTGVKTENVKELFKEKLQTQEKGSRKVYKKHAKKKTLIVLAASFAAALALGTIGAAAAGSFNAVLGEHFAGDRVNGVYSGADICINTADGYATEFLGISGDHHSVAAALNITNSYGKDFVSSDDVKNTYITTSLYGIVGSKDEKRAMNALGIKEKTDYSHNVDVSVSMWNGITHNDKYYGSIMAGSTEYILADSKSIKCIMRYDDTVHELIGEKMSINGEMLLLYTVKKDITDCSLSEGYDAEYLMEYGQPSGNASDQAKVRSIAEKIQQAKKTLANNEYVVKRFDYTGEFKMVYSIAEIRAENISLSGSWKLNYKAGNIVSISVNDNSFAPQGSYNGHSFSEIKSRITNIDADTFSAKVTIEYTGNTAVFDSTEKYDSENYWEDSISEYLKNNPITITLKNGETVLGVFETISYDSNKTGGRMECVLLYSNDTSWVTIVPEEIASADFAGNKII